MVSNIKAVLVDEYQDTNVVQYELMKCFATRRHNITIVGDPDQSIYAFRAAESTNLQRMRDEFPGTTVINLEENYRSSGGILKAALAVIEQDVTRIQKSVLPNHDAGTMPSYMIMPDSHAEGRFIVQEIKRMLTLSCGMLKPSDFAILVRTARLTRPIESGLTKAGIDYRVVGGFRFWEREEVKIFIGYLSVIKSRKSPSLLKILNSPKRGIGRATQAVLLNYSNAHQISLWETIERALRGEVKVTSKIKTALTKFVEIIESCDEVLATEKHDALTQVVEMLVERLDYKTVLQNDHSDTWTSRWENVEDFMAQVREFERAPEEPGLPDIDGILSSSAEDVLSRFLATMNLSPSEEEAHDVDPSLVVTISTIHGAKGLEWPVVFVPGVYEGSIPHSLSVPDGLDEERRLLYVAMTRAKGLLYLTYPKLATGAGAMFAKDSGGVLKQSQFITPETATYFRKDEPVITYTAVKSLGNILNRECPSSERFASARKEWCGSSIIKIFVIVKFTNFDMIVSQSRPRITSFGKTWRKRGLHTLSTNSMSMKMNTIYILPVQLDEGYLRERITGGANDQARLLRLANTPQDLPLRLSQGVPCGNLLRAIVRKVVGRGRK